MEQEEKVKIDLACGNNKRQGFLGVDIVKTDSSDMVFDLNTYPWPIESDSVDEINCSHYIEHIPHDIHNPNDKRDGLIQFMDEVYRIMKKGGNATIIAPYYSSMRAVGDPTHVRYIAEFSFFYYNKQWREDNKLEHYGINSNFDAKHSYLISSELSLRSEEVRNKAFRSELNAVEDIITELVKI